MLIADRSQMQSMKIFREITPLKNDDIYVVMDSINNGFDYPIHNHPEYEINLILGCSGNRIVGDSNLPFHHCDLAMLGPHLYHKWDGIKQTNQLHTACADPIRVITIQFGNTLFEANLLAKEPFSAIRRLLENAKRGLAFTGTTFQTCQTLMDELTRINGIDGVLAFMKLLDLLSKSTEVEILSSDGFNTEAINTDNKRIQIAYDYIKRHFSDECLKMEQVARSVHMSDSAFSHFFKKRANKSFTEFLLDQRIGYACKLLVESEEQIGAICHQSGFNNLANFNRQFKKHHGCSPQSFKKHYKELSEFNYLNQLTPNQFIPCDLESSLIHKPKQYAVNHTIHN